MLSIKDDCFDDKLCHTSNSNLGKGIIRMNLSNKKIFLYMNYFKDDVSIGITKKINAQIKTLQRMGLDVTYTSYVDDGAVIINNLGEIVYRKKYLVKSKKYERFNRRFLLIKTVREYLEKSGDKFDFAYLRWHTFDKTFLKMLNLFKKSGATSIIEAHAWTPDRKATSLISRYQIAMDNRYSKYAKKYVSLVAGMSEYEQIWDINTVKIDNAVDLESILPRQWIKNNDCFRIISVSNEYSYHGYDRLLKGIRNYYDAGGTRKIEVHFVGVFMEPTKKLCDELDLNDKIHFHGKMFGKELDILYNNCDFGIGALAHHRIGMYSGSSLKTKEYFAKGLPFVYGWKEPAFDETYPYALRIELCEDPIDMNQIFAFYDRIENDMNMIDNMRNFAKEHYSWENEFKKVFDALEKNI